MTPEEILQKAKNRALKSEQRRFCIDNWICPDCGADLECVEDYGVATLGRCPNCTEVVESAILFGLGGKRKKIVQKDFVVL